MVRFPFIMLVGLLLAEILEIGVLPPLRDALPDALRPLFAWQLLALCPLLAGLLRGELSGMVTAVVAALLFGFSTDPNVLGPALIGFGITAALAGRLTRYLRLVRFHNRFFAVFFLLLTSMLITMLIRKMFWTAFAIDLPWLGLIVTAIIGALLFAVLTPRFRLDLMDD